MLERLDLTNPMRKSFMNFDTRNGSELICVSQNIQNDNYNLINIKNSIFIAWSHKLSYTMPKPNMLGSHTNSLFIFQHETIIIINVKCRCTYYYAHRPSNELNQKIFFQSLDRSFVRSLVRSFGRSVVSWHEIIFFYSFQNTDAMRLKWFSWYLRPPHIFYVIDLSFLFYIFSFFSSFYFFVFVISSWTCSHLNVHSFSFRILIQCNEMKPTTLVEA